MVSREVAGLGPGREAGPATALTGALQHRDEESLIAELLNLRTTAEAIDGLVARGYPRSVAEQSVSAVVDSPIFAAAARSYKSNRKLAGLLKAMGRLFVHSGFELEKLQISSAEFYEHFFFNNRPVVLRGLMDDWAAPRLWTPEHFRSRYGNVVVEVMSGREGDPRYELNWAERRSHIRMADYIDLITDTASGNDCYLVARNKVLDMPEMRDLSDDFHCPAGFLDPETPERPYVRLWLGAAGTLTPLHCDDCNIFMGEVTGRKKVRLIPPYFYPSLYNTAEYYSPVDLDNVDLTRFPEMRDVPVLETALEPGEFLFIPIGWWHWVKSLELSASLTFTNLCNDQPPVMWPELLE